LEVYVVKNPTCFSRWSVRHNHEVIEMQANDIRGLKLLSHQTYN
jgi:hypothetical protein